jgi:hypothetical protein
MGNLLSFVDREGGRSRRLRAAGVLEVGELAGAEALRARVGEAVADAVGVARTRDVAVTGAPSFEGASAAATAVRAVEAEEATIAARRCVEEGGFGHDDVLSVVG